ncbi:hypothetical protein Tco_1444251, partial [Tanacetum coccineum]
MSDSSNYSNTSDIDDIEDIEMVMQLINEDRQISSVARKMPLQLSVGSTFKWVPSCTTCVGSDS